MKLDELKTIAGNTKSTVIGVTESKVDNSISDSEVEILHYCILRCDRNRMGEELHVMLGRICVLI